MTSCSTSMDNHTCSSVKMTYGTADLGKLAKRDACRPPYCSCAMVRGNVNWLLSAATVHEQRADNARFCKFNFPKSQ